MSVSIFEWAAIRFNPNVLDSGQKMHVHFRSSLWKWIWFDSHIGWSLLPLSIIFSQYVLRVQLRTTVNVCGPGKFNGQWKSGSVHLLSRQQVLAGIKMVLIHIVLQSATYRLLSCLTAFTNHSKTKTFWAQKPAVAVEKKKLLLTNQFLSLSRSGVTGRFQVESGGVARKTSPMNPGS